ncbi:ankyrin repeat domain-containing protein SOWAHB [Scleropages formosus]|uniref:ankyrin repeat domain-containing protein SOWAHB n=1 Tax=Scleropages formosus TaxID=113540 RepID=UPI0010FAB70E|nr:ankyrin repeat domain-containing protein SOWAHB-like [Scleropages formosus]
MAAELSQGAVLSFLRSRGGRVRNAELLGHFWRFLREGEHEDRARNRELFKRFVNAVAVVQQQRDGAALVVLRRKFAVEESGTGKKSPQRRRGRGASSSAEREKRESPSRSSSSSSRRRRSSEEVLASAGILHLRGESACEQQQHQPPPPPPPPTGSPPAAALAPAAGPRTSGLTGGGAAAAAESQRERSSGALVPAPGARRRLRCPEQLPAAAVRGGGEAGHRDCCCRSSSSSSASTLGDAFGASPSPPEEPGPAMCSRVLPPSSCGAPLGRKPDSLATIGSEEKEEEEEDDDDDDNGGGGGTGPAASASYSDCHRLGLSASHGDLVAPARRGPEGLHAQDWASEETLHLPGSRVLEMLERAQEARLLTLLHRPERKVTPGPTRDEVAVPLRSGASRSRRELRSRMCRSLGADLDQPFPEDVVSARRNRLYLLSSSLSINYPLSTYSRTHRSPAGPEARSGTACAIRGPYGQRSVPVPLDPKEHDWLLKAASGSWTEIYALFREEPTLLDKRDFISGYTLLHWIAKHGDHRVLNTLWYGVNKAGMDLDVDARTTCGYTPLHLAAIHGHKKMIRLLVHKFKAKVTLRDTSGKRPWQYLASSGSGDLLQLLGSPKSGSAEGKRPLSSESVLVQPNTASPRVKRQTSLAALLKHKSVLKIPLHSESFV